MKKCPFCAEEIQDEAVKCRFCGEFITQSQSGKIRYECVIRKFYINKKVLSKFLKNQSLINIFSKKEEVLLKLNPEEETEEFIRNYFKNTGRDLISYKKIEAPKNIIDYLEKQRRTDKSQVQNAGCLLLILGLFAPLIFGPLGIIVGIIGLVMLIIGSIK